VFIAFAVLLAVMTHDKPDSFNELSRLAAVESLVERGTWAITDSDKTVKMDDKAFWKGEFYSDKTPIFTVMTAVPYYFFYNFMGAEIGRGSCSGDAPICSYWWFSNLMVVIPASAMLALFYYVGRQLGVNTFIALMFTVALGLGTMILPFGIVYNSHVPAAAYLFIGFVGLITPGLSDQNRRIALGISGFFAGLTFATDLPSLFLMAALCFVALVRYRRQFLWFAGGMFVPLLLTAILNYQMHQSIIPIYFRPGVYTWEGSPWIDAMAGRNRPEVRDWWLRVFRATVGDHGMLVTWPVMLFPIAGLLRQAFHKGASYQLEAVVTLGAIGLHLAGFLFAIDGFGGRAYGIRYLISFFPLLFFFAYFISPVRYSVPKRGGYWLSFALTLTLSCASTFEGAAQPWGKWHPILFLEPIEVRPYVRLVSPYIWRPNHPLAAEIGPGVLLVGYDLTPQYSRPGDKVSLSIFWRSTQMSPEAKVKVFVHIRSADNQSVIQADHWVLESFAVPSSRWERWVAGDSIVRDDSFIEVPVDLPSGTYKILVGLYNPENLERLPIVNDQSGENAVYIGDLVIF
jgi:hypothetical protein